MNTLSLLQLNSMVQEVVETCLQRTYWVETELASVNESRGHLYLELIEKHESTNTPVAKASAKCWANVWQALRVDFERVTGERLRSGMKVLMQVYAQFHPAFGFSWIVTDIDATYTLGDMARRRKEIIRQLKEEGVFDLQRQLSLPLFCQRIAVVSSQSAAGYGDFCNQLMDNAYGFVFHTELFPAIMQGEQVESSIVEQLDRINERCDDFDCVVIIRGGGATSDMSGFDTLLLAENVANFPLPVITGIGHERDECVLDMIAYQRVKTPTAAAAFLIDHLAEVERLLDQWTDSIHQTVSLRLERERMRMTSLQTRIPMLFALVRSKQESRLDNMWQRLTAGVKEQITERSHRLELYSQRVKNLDPQLVLNRGYSMTLAGGKVVTDASMLAPGEVITTRMAKGEVVSIVRK